MTNTKIKITIEQAQEFAFAVFTDIAEYVSTHAEEYEEFLRNEKLAEGGTK